VARFTSAVHVIRRLNAAVRVASVTSGGWDVLVFTVASSNAADRVASVRSGGEDVLVPTVSSGTLDLNLVQNLLKLPEIV
jgi:hypothetical protein